MSPERIIGDLDLKSDKGISKCDIWSVGVVIFFLVFGYLPYQASSLNKLIKCIQKNKLNFEMQGVSPSVLLLLDLLSKILVTNVDQRLDAAQALNHKFLTTNFAKKETLKDTVFNKMKVEWLVLLFKDQMKSYISFYSSQEQLGMAFVKIFEDQSPTNIS